MSIKNNKTGMYITSIGDTKKSPSGDLGVKNKLAKLAGSNEKPAGGVKV